MTVKIALIVRTNTMILKWFAKKIKNKILNQLNILFIGISLSKKKKKRLFGYYCFHTGVKHHVKGYFSIPSCFIENTHETNPNYFRFFTTRNFFYHV